MASDSDRTPNHPTAALRLSENRRVAHGEPQRQASAVHVTYIAGAEGIDAEDTEAAAVWGLPFQVAGVDLVTVLVDYTRVAGTSVQLVAQCSMRPDTDNWYDVWQDPGGAGWARYQASVGGTVSGKFAITVPVRGRHMRLKLWVPNATTDRASLSIIRDQAGQGS